MWRLSCCKHASIINVCLTEIFSAIIRKSHGEIPLNQGDAHLCVGLQKYIITVHLVTSTMIPSDGESFTEAPGDAMCCTV